MKIRKGKTKTKDGCVWQTGLSRVVGQDMERGEGRPDETTGSTWVPLAVYICRRASAQSQPVSTASPYGGFTFCCASFDENSVLLQERLGRSNHLEKLLLFDRTCLPVQDEQLLCFWFYCSDFVAELLYLPFSWSFGSVKLKRERRESSSKKKLV